jgi:hypothetical protein
MTEGIRVGARVYLSDCPHGQPGTVVKLERGRAVVYWRDLDSMAKHNPESLIAVEPGLSEAVLRK